MALDTTRIRYFPNREKVQEINYMGLLDEFETASIAVYYYAEVLHDLIGQEPDDEDRERARRWADYRNECMQELMRRDRRS